jgi:hypothetical protein
MPDNDPIIWKELTPNQRNAMIAQHIFGRKVIEWSKGRDLLMVREDNPRLSESTPAYTESMDAAWQVLQKMAEHEKLHVFAGQLYLDVGPLVPNDIPLSQFAIARLAKLTPTMICVAALRAHGLTIECEE